MDTIARMLITSIIKLIGIDFRTFYRVVRTNEINFPFLWRRYRDFLKIQRKLPCGKLLHMPLLLSPGVKNQPPTISLFICVPCHGHNVNEEVVLAGTLSIEYYSRIFLIPAARSLTFMYSLRIFIALNPANTSLIILMIFVYAIVNSFSFRW